MSSAEHPPAAHNNVRILNPLEVENWDAQLSNFSAATFFHSVAWTRVLHSTYGYRPLYFVTGEPNHIRSLLPLMEVDSWLTGRRGVSLPFTDECEPLGSEPGATRYLFDAAHSYAKKNAWKYLECRNSRVELGAVPASSSYFGHSLELKTDETALFAQFDGSARRAVRKAEQHKLTVEFSQSLTATRAFYDLFCITRQRHGAPPQPFGFFANIQRHVLAQNKGWVVLARQEGIPVAGAVFFHFDKSVIYKFGASDDAFQHLRANNLVIWEGIRRYAREGFTTLDLGRTALQNEGLRRFKLSWGTQERLIEYIHYDFRKMSFTPLGNEHEDLIRRVGQSMPRFVSRLIGILLYKHIAALACSFGSSQFATYS